MRYWLAWLFVLLGQLAAGTAWGQDCAPDQLLVRFRADASPTVRMSLHQALGAVVQTHLAALDVDVVSLPHGTPLRKASLQYSRSRWVQYAESNPIWSTHAAPNDPSFGQEWGMARVQAPLAWNITQGREDIAIAILDSGIAQDHEDLSPRIAANVNFSSSSSADDVYGHGTHLAGIVAAVADNGIGIAGLAPRCSLMNVKVARDEDGKSLASWVAQGIVWAADNGARVICMSFGAPTPSQAVADAVGYAWNRGVVLVASAGNGGTTAPNYPAAFDPCIAVAATDANDGRPSWSGFGSWVDVAAPGVGILSTLPNAPNAFKQQGYGTLNGTSQATAFVAGLAGLVWSTSFGTSNAAVRARIESTCDRIAGTGAFWTSGRINAARAVGAIP
jgi:thermitase